MKITLTHSGFFILITVCVITGCTIKTPEVTFTSERTALENQILGTYRTIEEDSWIITSARSSDEESPGLILPKDRRAVLEAFANRRFNADDIYDFKTEGIVGENDQGFLTILPNERYQHDPDYSNLVDHVVAEENSDRQVIMERILEMNTADYSMNLEEVRRVFSQMNRDASPQGTWLESETGKWVKK
ncbi:MAG: DUF1318 domain-containing protein [bacterium]